MSAESGSKPFGPGACVDTSKRLAPAVSSTELTGMFSMRKPFPQSSIEGQTRLYSRFAIGGSRSVDRVHDPLVSNQLGRREASIDRNRGPVDECGFVARQVDQRVRNICCGGEPSQRHFPEP